jgi:dihydrolipoamide dehydrogenase
MTSAPSKNYDLIIIGSGPGGYVAALYASRHKLNVCMIEKDLVGGTCLNRGCIPTKALLYSASILSRVKESKEYGIETGNIKVNFSAIAARKDMVVARLRAGIETLFRANKIELIKGSAKITGTDTVSINGEQLKAKSIIIATGSRPMAIFGINVDEADVCSSDGILKIAELPKSVGIVGGGVIGCEFASLFNALGVKVFIIELLDRILPTQSREVSRKMETIFKKRGISIHTAAKLESITRSSLRAPQGRSNLFLKIASSPSAPRNDESLDVEKVLVSVGRASNVEGIGLEEIGIKIEKGRISVDGSLRTSIKNIYAIGDCIKGPLLAHKASYDGIVAVDNILGKTRTADYSSVPNCIWTDPEVASVGLTEEEAKAKYPGSKIAKFPYIASGKAFIMGRPEGFIKIIGGPEGNIIGVEIMGEGACDLIGEATLARSINMSIKDWANVIHGHPTLSEIFQEAAHIFLGTPIHSV